MCDPVSIAAFFELVGGAGGAAAAGGEAAGLAGGLGSAAGAAGAGALGTGALGGGAFLGEGVASGIPAWDAASGGAAAGFGAGDAAAGGAAGGSIAPMTSSELVAPAVTQADVTGAALGPTGELIGAGALGAGASNLSGAQSFSTPSSPVSSQPFQSLPTGGGGGGFDAGSMPSSGGLSPAAENTGASMTTTTPDPVSNWEGGPQGPMSSTQVLGPPASGNSSIDAALKALGINSGKDALQYANVGLGAASMFKQAQMGSSAQKQMNQIAAPTAAVSADLLGKFQKGQISAADSFSIAQNAQHQKAQVDQYYAKAGLSNSSMHTQALAQIDKEAENQRQQAVQNMLKEGLAASGVANPTLVAGVNAGVLQDQQAMKAMQDFLKTLSGMGAQQAAAPAQAPATSGAPT